MATAQRYDVPLVLVYSADLVGALEFYDSRRAVLATMSKVFAMGAASRTLRRRMLDVRSFLRDHDQPITQRAPFHLLRACQAGATSVILLNRKRADMMQAWAPDVPVHVIPSGIDRLPAAAAPPELTWRDGALRVVYVGRFAREKNLPPVIEALRVARDEGVEVDFTIVGEGELADDLAEVAREHGVTDRFRAIGPYRRHQLRGIYESADVFVFASVSDTQGFVLNEAAHEGLPLLVADPRREPRRVRGRVGVRRRGDRARVRGRFRRAARRRAAEQARRAGEGAGRGPDRGAAVRTGGRHPAPDDRRRAGHRNPLTRRPR
jgi:glycosyltransferase involved in cell wall biosynthesis